jgi:hypothetical protein
MKTILVGVVSMTAVCLAAVPAFAQSHQSGGGSGGVGSSTPSSPPNVVTSNVGGVGTPSPLGPRIVPGTTATGNPGIGSGGTARFSPGVLAQAQSLQQRLAAARAAAEQGGSEAPLDTIPVAGEPAVPPNVERIRGRG